MIEISKNDILATMQEIVRMNAEEPAEIVDIESLEEECRLIVYEILDEHPELRDTFDEDVINQFIPFYVRCEGGAR